ncbi:sugar ABC transporter ATP-binding protein [Sphaerisporangium perillae]|uniref:sugar ABC transporter ATP-binding protein n=1 Tax=Sphaerisporangium perillae TaxID=2935860 RepID=UPI00200D6009|nr:sugar ABC transporter ATP-binding protein [Sphaerisporangium perillae]
MRHVLSVEHASKHFGGVIALDDVSFDVQAGEVHALLGQNGSGKSTLIKCLSGYHSPEPGWRLTINGTKIERPLHPGEFRQLGMSFVHQDLGLVPSLSITENLRAGVIVAGGLSRIRWREQYRIAKALLDEFEIDIDPRDAVETLRPVDRALIALVRAVDELRRWKGSAGAAEGGVLFLDEVTAVLDRAGKNRVGALVRRIVADGAGVVVVSHDLKEMVDVANRITMLRDGSLIATVDAAEYENPSGIESLIELMTGNRRDNGAINVERRATPPGDRVVAAISDLTGSLARKFSAELHEGEVLAVTGLVGAGWEEIPALLFGARRAEAGTLTLDGETFDVARMSPGNAISHGIGLVPANRQEDGVVSDLSVRANVSLPVLSTFMAKGRLVAREERARIRAVLDGYRVVPPDPELEIQALSGGNQQKAVVAKWLNIKPRLLLLQDPTQGVDVSARERIQDIVWRAARAGMAVLYASANYEEVAAVADRVIVVSDGVITTEIVGADITEDAVTAACLRGAPSGLEEVA